MLNFCIKTGEKVRLYISTNEESMTKRTIPLKILCNIKFVSQKIRSKPICSHHHFPISGALRTKESGNTDVIVKSPVAPSSYSISTLGTQHPFPGASEDRANIYKASRQDLEIHYGSWLLAFCPSVFTKKEKKTHKTPKFMFS